MKRRWWGRRCSCEALGYGADDIVGLEGSLTRALERDVCRLCADVSFEKSREHLTALRGVKLSKEVVRQACHGRGRQLADWQKTEKETPRTFAAAAGEVEFTIDAGKVNTVERGWRDLKIGAMQKRPRGAAAEPDQWHSRQLPAATARVAWASIAPIKKFRRSWRRWSRRLGVGQAAELHVLGDGADWIWRAVDRTLTGSQQTLDIYHGLGHIALAGKRLYGEHTAAAETFLARGRQLLLEGGWWGICDLVGEEYAKEDTPERRAPLEKLIAYFIKHKQRLDYRGRLTAGQAIGSGHVEGWAKTLGLRLKARGARWRHKNTRSMATLLCVRHSSQWSAYWSQARDPQKT